MDENGPNEAENSEFMNYSESSVEMTKTKELEEILISTIRTKPELWNSSLDQYRNRDMKNAAWKFAANATGKSEEWCKSKWQKLRDGFNRKKKSIKGKTGQSRKKLESTGHFLALKFLDDVPTTAKTTGNVADQLEGETEIDLSENSENRSQAQENLTGIVKPSSIPEGLLNQNATPTYSSSRNRKGDEVDKELVTFLKRPKQSDDDFHHFGMAVAGQLRKMNANQSQWAMMTIQRVIYDTVQPPPT